MGLFKKRSSSSSSSSPSSSSSARRSGLSSYKRVWFKADLLCCEKCHRKVDTYLNAKKRIGEVKESYSTMYEGVIFAEGNFNVTEMIKELSMKLCNSLQVEEIERLEDEQRHQESLNESSLRHQRPLQDETGQRRYNDCSVSVISYLDGEVADTDSLRHQRPLQDENGWRRYDRISSSVAVADVIEEEGNAT